MSREKTQHHADEMAVAAPGAGAGTATDAAPQAAVVSPALSLQPTLAVTIAHAAGLTAAILVVGFVWFGSQPVSSGLLPLMLILSLFIGHVASVYRGQTLWAAATLLAMILIAWHHAFAEMWHRWFPAWATLHSAPITTRLTAGDSYYSHAPLVPVASGVIAFLIYYRVGLPTQRTRGSNLAGAALFGWSIFVQIIAGRGDVNFLSGLALIGVLGGLVLLWGGWPLARAYWLPVAFLFFMVPFPMDTIAKINFALKSTATDAALWVTNHIFAVPAVSDGGSSVFLSPDTSVNPPKPKTLVVENVCGGLRSMISLVCFATLFALICRVKGLWRWMMLALAFPLAIGCNVMRITSMMVGAHLYSVEAVGEESPFHLASGIAVFALALAAMFAIERVIIFISHKLKKNWVDDRLLGYLDELPPSRPQGLRSWHPVATGVLVFVAALTTFWVYEAPAEHRGDMARQAFTNPDGMPVPTIINGETYAFTEGEMTSTERAILQTNDYLKRMYETGVGRNRKQVSLTIIFSANNRKGTHPPEVCLEGGGGRIVSKQLHELTFAGIDASGNPTTETASIRELISEHKRHQTLHLYLYKCGDSYTPNYVTQQLIIFVNGIIARNSAGALIRIDVPIGETPTNAQVETARKLALDAANVFLPQIDQGLP